MSIFTARDVVSIPSWRETDCFPYSSSLPPEAGEVPSLPVRATAGALFARTRFVHIQRATIHLFAIGRAHRGLGLRIVVHGHEREPARFARHPVHHQMDFVDSAVLFEQILKIVLGGLESEITYVQFHCVLNLGKTTELQSRSRESGFKPPMSDAHLTIYRAVKLNRVSNKCGHYRPDQAKHNRSFHRAVKQIS